MPARRSLDVLLVLDDSRSAHDAAAGRIVVAIDVLRATTTIVTALAHGAAFVVPVTTPQEAVQLRATRFPEALLCGERNNHPPPGFDLGNSPGEYIQDRIKRKPLLLTTTNGTRLIRAVQSAREVWIGAFVNRAALCRRLQETSGNILLACAGSERRFAMEDGLFAGAVAATLEGPDVELSDSARLVRDAWHQQGGNLLAALSQTEHARRLIAANFAADVAAAAQLDRYPIVPQLRDGRIVAEHSNGSPTPPMERRS